MSYRIKKVAVLGSGVMGSGIACHLANVGMEVVMLDILPFDIDASETNPNIRNKVANDALAKAIKSKPAALFDKSYAQRITTGNFEDNFDKISDADWIVEVVVERLDIKQSIFEKVEAYRKKGSLVSSNTSSIPIHLLAEGRSSEFKNTFVEHIFSIHHAIYVY